MGVEGVVYFENALSKTRGNLILCASAKFIEIDIRTPGLSQEIGNKPICVFLPPTRRLLARNVSTLTPWILLLRDALRSHE